MSPFNYSGSGPRLLQGTVKRRVDGNSGILATRPPAAAEFGGTPYQHLLYTSKVPNSSCWSYVLVSRTPLQQSGHLSHCLAIVLGVGAHGYGSMLDLQLPDSLRAGREQIRRDSSRDWICFFFCLIPTRISVNLLFIAKESDSWGTDQYIIMYSNRQKNTLSLSK